MCNASNLTGVETGEGNERAVNAVALAVASLIRCRNPGMSAVAYRISTILFHSGVSFVPFLSFPPRAPHTLSRAPKFPLPLPLSTPATQASPAMARRAAKTGQEGSTVAPTSSPKQYLKSLESFKQLSDVFTQIQ